MSPVVFRADGVWIFDLRFAIVGPGDTVTEAEMIQRTKQFALRVLRLIDALPETRTGRIIASQLGRSATSVGANYRAACCGRSKAEFCAKLGIVEEEADESLYWLELITESMLMKPSKVTELKREANELIAIVAASRRTASRSIAVNGNSNRKSKIENRK